MVNCPLTLLVTMTAIAIFVSITIPKGLPLWAMETLFYCSVIISFFLILSLAMGKPFTSFIPKSLDKKLGDFSYPFYLLHYQAAAITSYMIYGQVTVFKGSLTTTSVVLTFSILFLLSLIIIKWIDNPIEKLRTKIRNAIIKSKAIV